MNNPKIENGYVIYSDAYAYNEFILLDAGSDDDGFKMFKAVKIIGKKNKPYDFSRWRALEGAAGAPKGFKWYSNGKSRFDKSYETALVRICETI